MKVDADWVDRKLYKAFNKARKGKLTTVDEYKFETHFAENLLQLREDILTRQYRPSRGTAFISHDPVDREIFAAPFRDRVVHHFIYDLIYDWWDRRLIYGSYSCREGKGTDAGIRDLYEKMRRVSRGFKEPTMVAKIDLSSYFCSIPRRNLFERVKWGLEKQFLEQDGSELAREIYRMLKFLCAQIIFDDPVRDVRVKGSAKDWAEYPRRKSLFYQRPGVGLVIGNLTSQMFSNIYLDQLDRFAVHTLGIKNYGRYVDDAFFVLPVSEERRFFEVEMPKIVDLVTGMGLRLNPKKTFCQDIWHGVPFLGAIVYPYHILPGRRVARNFKLTFDLVQAGELDLDSLISYLGRLQHFDAQKLIAAEFERHGLNYEWDTKNFGGSKYYTEWKSYQVKKFW